jgi:hypothetical protein
MIGKKVLWFSASTFVSFVVFAIIARGIELGIMKRQSDLRLTSCEGQSVISEGGPQYEWMNTTSFASAIEAEEQLWQAQGIHDYCAEMNTGNMLAGSGSLVLLVQNHQVDSDLSNCFIREGTRGEDFQCRRLLLNIDYGLDTVSIDALFYYLNYMANRSNYSVTVTFDSTYHFPISIFSYQTTALDSDFHSELIAFVPLD